MRWDTAPNACDHDRSLDVAMIILQPIANAVKEVARELRDVQCRDRLVLQPDCVKRRFEFVEDLPSRPTERHDEEAEIRLSIETGGGHEVTQPIEAEPQTDIGEENIARLGQRFIQIG